MNFNAIFMGYLSEDPELKTLDNGNIVCHFSVAQNRRFIDHDGHQVEEVTWFRVNTWGRLAEVCNLYLQKASPVFVLGRLQPDRETGGPRIWINSGGEARASYEITAISVQFLGNKIKVDESLLRVEEAKAVPEAEATQPGRNTDL